MGDNITGTWIGKLGGTLIGDIEVSINQSDNNLFGQISITNDPRNLKFDFTGTHDKTIIVEAAVKIQPSEQQVIINIEGALRKQEQMYISGEYKTKDCMEYGTFILFRKDIVNNKLPESNMGVKIDYPEHYGKRLVVFLDILGFKNIVYGFPKKPSQFQKVLKAIRFFGYDQETASEMSDKYNLNWEYSIFSDSVIISAPYSNTPIFHLIARIGYVCFLLLGDGILIRGGITIGRMFHEKNCAIGQGLIEAYEIENNLAIYPRIVISQDVAECLDKDIEAARSNSIISSKISKFYRTDADGCKYIDYLYACSYYMLNKGEDSSRYLCNLNKIRQVLTNKIDETKEDQKNNQKIMWLANYLNDILTENPDFEVPLIKKGMEANLD